jgi:hypothetical protein
VIAEDWSSAWSWSTVLRIGPSRIRTVLAALADIAPDVEAVAIADAGLRALDAAERRGVATGPEIVAIRRAVAEADARDLGDADGLLLG